MPISIVVGGQFGSEGKGKVAHYMSQNTNVTVAVRVGGSNSGHTVVDSNGDPLIFRQLPTASILADIDCVFPSGSYISLDILEHEIALSKIDPRRIKIDPFSVVMKRSYALSERAADLKQRIGSTETGIGAAIIERISRKGDIVFAKDEPTLDRYIVRSKDYMVNALKRNEHILIEGTQGFGLSLLHSKEYPYVTSRDTSAAGFLSETGLSPLDVKNIYMVIRSFPIRVAGDSGLLPNEINWDTLTKESGSLKPLVEYTSVTKNVRRIGRFDANVVIDAINTNNPSVIILNHLDYIDSNASPEGSFNDKHDAFIKKTESLIMRRIDFVGLNPNTVIKR